MNLERPFDKHAAELQGCCVAAGMGLEVVGKTGRRSYTAPLVYERFGICGICSMVYGCVNFIGLSAIRLWHFYTTDGIICLSCMCNCAQRYLMCYRCRLGKCTYVVHVAKKMCYKNRRVTPAKTMNIPAPIK